MRCCAVLLAFVACGDDGGPTGGGDGIELAGGQLEPLSIAVDATHVYWTSYGDGTIARVPKAGGDIEIVAAREVTPGGIAVGPTHVYWTELTTPGRVRRAALDGFAVETVAEGQGRPTSIWTDGTDVIWCNQGTGPLYEDGGLMIAAGGAAPMELTTAGGNVIAFVVAPATIFASDLVGNRLLSMPRSGGESVVALVDRPYGIAATADTIYYATSASPAPIAKISTAGGMPEVVATELMYPTRLDRDDTHVYASVGGSGPAFLNGSIIRIPIAGGPLEVVAATQGRPIGIALDADHVYWVNAKSGQIMTTAK